MTRWAVMPRRHDRGPRSVAALLSGAMIVAGLPGCDSHLTQDPVAATGDAEEPEEDDDEVPAPSADEPSGGIAVPDPTLFGLDPDPARWGLRPSELRVEARAAAAIDPRVDAIEVRATPRPARATDRYVDFSFELTALSRGRALEHVVLDSSRLDELGPLHARPLLAAMLDDVSRHAAPRCDDASAFASNSAAAGEPSLALGLPGAAMNFRPGDPQWWARALCPTQWDETILGFYAAQFALAMWRATLSGSAMEMCEALPIPVESEACIADVEEAVTELSLIAVPSLTLSIQLATMAQVVADQAKNLAAAVGLGGPAGPPAWPVFAAANALTVVSVCQGALAMASRATSSVLRATVALSFPQLIVYQESGLQIVYPRMQRYQEALHFVVLCMQNVVKWIAVAGLIGLVAGVALALGDRRRAPESLAGFGPAPSHGGAPGLRTRQVALGSNDLFVIDGPLLPRANENAHLYPVAIDVAALPSLVGAATLQVVQGRTFRTVQFGYLDPELELDEDVWGVDALTGLPMLLASAGTPVVIDFWGGRPLEIPELVVQGGSVHARGAELDLGGQSLDENGHKVGLPWLCMSLFGYCPLGFETTGSPEQIAAGEIATERWQIFTTSSIVDVESGEPFEDYAGYVVEINAPFERPSSPCYDSFDYNAWAWVYNPARPGCLPGFPFPPW